MLEPNSPGPLADALILIVDDTPQNLKLLRYILSRAGARILEARTPDDARQLLAGLLPDLILLDILLPGTDGFTLCEEIKAQPALQQIPIIFVSALDTPIDKVKGFSVGGSDYVSKPFDPAEVLARVTHHLSVDRKRQQLEREKRQLAQVNRELAEVDETALESVEIFGARPGRRVLNGKYVLHESIGSGGFAVVFRATVQGSPQPVAVKILRPLGGLSHERRLSRFRREGASACRVNHPNAVAILDSGTTRDGISYLVMELLVGHSLRQELRDGQPLPLVRCLQVVLPVCAVLVEAHAAGVLHRDIKPDNVFLHRGETGEIVKVLDFGIAKLLEGEGPAASPLTGTGELMGTPAYMSPEQLVADPVDGRADVYSVAVMLYELLTGQLPFPPQSESMLRTMLAQLNHAPSPPSQHNAAIPGELDVLILSALAKEAAARPTASAFHQGLLAIAERVFAASPAGGDRLPKN